MSEQPQVNSSKGRIHSVLDSIKKLVAEDPLIGGLFFVIIVPLGGIVVQAVLSMNWGLAFLAIGVLAVSVLIVFFPLLIFKALRSEKTEIRDVRKSILEDERIRRQKSWELTQERATKVIDAKIMNLQASTAYLFDQNERFEKYLIHESAQEIGKSIEANFRKIQVGEEVSFRKAMSSVLDSYKAIDEKYDHLIDSFSVFQAYLELIAKEQESESETPPKIIIKDKVASPIESPPEPISEEISEKPEKSVNEISPTLAPMSVGYAEEKTFGPQESSVFEEALKVVDDLADHRDPELPPEELIKDPEEDSNVTADPSDFINKPVYKFDDSDIPEIKEEDPSDKWETGSPDVVPVMKEESPPPNTWQCSKCGNFLSNKRVRCPSCGIGKGAQS